MTLDRLRPMAERVLDPFVTAADRVGLTPNGISVLAFGFAVAADCPPRERVDGAGGDREPER